MVTDRHPELNSEIAPLVTEAVNNPDEVSLAGEIEAALDDLDEGDVLARSGRRRGGYTEFEEAAGLVLIETMEPYFDRLEHQLTKGNETGALAICKAIVLAMYRFGKNEHHPLLELYEEYPEETADWAVRMWRTAGDVDKAAVRKFDLDRKFPSDFVKRFAPDWEWLTDDTAPY